MRDVYKGIQQGDYKKVAVSAGTLVAMSALPVGNSVKGASVGLNSLS